MNDLTEQRKVKPEGVQKKVPVKEKWIHSQELWTNSWNVKYQVAGRGEPEAASKIPTSTWHIQLIPLPPETKAEVSGEIDTGNQLSGH